MQQLNTDQMIITDARHMPIVKHYGGKIGVVSTIDRMVDTQMELSPGIAILAIVLDTLSGRTPLYRLRSLSIDVWCRPLAECNFFPARVTRLTLTVESKCQFATLLFRPCICHRRTEARKTESDSKGVVFSLDFRGHIDVSHKLILRIEIVFQEPHLHLRTNLDICFLPFALDRVFSDHVQ
jgi:hypothetical protein